MGRDGIIARLEALRSENPAADLAFYAYRDLNRTPHEAFLKACIERNPVSILGSAALDETALLARIAALPGESIYDDPGRLAQPDEVWNFGRGDGLEKALLLADILHHRRAEPITITITEGAATLAAGVLKQTYPSNKELAPAIWNYPL
jgi:hypothetical protein